MKKIVLTGACGNLGTKLRAPLSGLCDRLVSSDIREAPDTLLPNESYQKADLGSYQEVEKIIEGADIVVHFGAICNEAPFDAILHANIVGVYNVWEAARKCGVRRVVYASSVHAVGMYPLRDGIGLDAPHRPDSFYGLAKCFAEDLASLYWDKCGLESVCLRLFSCAEVNSIRSLGAWLSENDLIQLVQRAIAAPAVGFSLIYGISNNTRAPLDNKKARHIGFAPQDNAEKYAEQILSNAPPADPTDPAQTCIGGAFTTGALGEGHFVPTYKSPENKS